MKELEALKAVDFDWTRHTISVWDDCNYDVPELHKNIRDDLAAKIDVIRSQNSPNSPLGWVIKGRGGSGKTHLLGALRKIVIQKGASFVMVDMTDVKDFWDTVLQGYCLSLLQMVEEDKSQAEILLQYLLEAAGYQNDEGEIKRLAAVPPANLDIYAKKLIRRHPREALQYADVIKALFLINSDDPDAKSLAYTWLQGIKIEEADKVRYQLSRVEEEPQRIIQGLSWIMSVRGPAVLALDQMDAIVAQHHLAGGAMFNSETATEEQKTSQAIIQGIAGGLMALRDTTKKTLVLASCVETTWEIIEKHASLAADRYESPTTLAPMGMKEIAQSVIAMRLAPAYKTYNVSPPYPTWPFKAECFEKADPFSPREILKRCDLYRKKWLVSEGARQNPASLREIDLFEENPGQTEEVKPPDVEYKRLDEIFSGLKPKAPLGDILDEAKEDDLLDSLLEWACRCIVKENPVSDSVDIVVDNNFPGGKSCKPLHARIRVIHRNQDDREEHCCFRGLLRTNAVAYQARLKAAMTASGIDRQLSFRKLMIVRKTPVPSGAVTQLLNNQFRSNGGLFAMPTNDEMQTLWALQQMELKRDSLFEKWLLARKPASQLRMLEVAVKMLQGISGTGQSEAVSPPPPTQPPPGKPPKTETPASMPKVPPISKAPQSPISSSPKQLDLPIGRRLMGDQLQQPISIPMASLRKHAVVLAGSGSGKTVLLKRLIEESAMMGIPSIVIDCANDLALLGDPWASPPAGWNADDPQKAKEYFSKADVVVWTPGLQKGNPLVLDLLPDLSVLTDDPDEFGKGVAMAVAALQDIVAPGKGETDKHKKGVLSYALQYFGRNCQGNLKQFIELLKDLPAEATGGIPNAGKLAEKMVASLLAEMAGNVLLNQTGSPLDPAILFGLGSKSGKTRISVVNLCAFASDINAQRGFLNCLAMTLFTWIKKNPAPAGVPLRGLLVVDEAKEFVPSVHSTACKESFIRLADQARKYGLGLILATQQPKSIDSNIVANCVTHFYGRCNSPSAIETIQELAKLKGGAANDVASLPKGTFYLSGETIPKPVKIACPMCLSFHESPLEEQEVIKRALKNKM